MKDGLRRAVVATGLYFLATPGIAAAHLPAWQIVGLGAMAGLVTAAVMWR